MNHHAVPHNTISLLAPAKINLALHVTGRRDDGYHLLESLVAFAAYGDRIDVSPAFADRFTVSGPFAQGIPVDTGNLVLKARDALKERFAGQTSPVAIHLTKNLPIASGIGGGSSDAAATLAALNMLWNLGLDLPALCGIGLKLGADLPMCLHGQQIGSPLIARGIGEALTSLPRLPSLPIVLINDGTGISTPDVFRALTCRDNPPLPSPADFPGIEAVCAYLRQTRNDLYPAALALSPALGGVLSLLRETGARFAQMSGSGATCFGIFPDNTAAERAAVHIKERHPDWFVVATQTRA
ncbi:4-(cytidine 5'-diphospho)-2-C-methyl-D-erythritol kinase [Brucella sp. IR073]|uniref:4-(cytidine 5'-diphospho)-2-C-methyl-D-erythritol kinase n=1 Tax=unclassified Brucella TaxID=2632610 RepID=UPI003B984D82